MSELRRFRTRCYVRRERNATFSPHPFDTVIHIIKVVLSLFSPRSSIPYTRTRDEFIDHGSSLDRSDKLEL